MTLWSRAAVVSHLGGAPFLLLFFSVALLAANVTPPSAWASECADDSPAQKAPRIDINSNGTATDIQTGLTWMRCALGQLWTGNSCEGAPKTWSWSAAKAELDAMNSKGGFAGFTDWRLPRLPEIASLVEPGCRDPRINLAVFPATAPRAFWSSSAKRGESGVIYTLSFGREGVELLSVDDLALARPVREGH